MSAQLASHEQEQQELWKEIDRVLELACRSLSPKDGDLLRWACKGDSPSRKQQWAEMACSCGEDV